MVALNSGYSPNSAATSAVWESNSQDSELEDIHLIHQMAGGDQVSLADFYDKHAKLLFSLASHILNDATEPENVLLHSFNQIWEKALAFDKNFGSPLHWALSIVHDEALKILKMKQSRSRLSNEKSAVKLVGPYDFNEVDSVNSFDFPKNQITQYIMLSTKQRETIELVYFRGFSSGQVARKLNETPRNINACLCAGLTALSNYRSESV